MHQHRRYIIVVAICLALGAICVWVWSDLRDPFNDQNFDQINWRNATPKSRGPMARDLIRNHIPLGATTAQVRVLLGNPTEVLGGSTDPGGNQLIGDSTYSYYLGSWSSYGFDSAFVYIHFDKNGRVVTARIRGY